MILRCAINFALVLGLVFAPLASYAEDPPIRLPISKGEASPLDGIVINEAMAKRNAKQKNELIKLRADYQVDTRSWKYKEDEIYKPGIEKRDARIVKLEEAKNSFWNQNKFSIGIGIGLIVGGAIVIGAITANNKANQ